MTDRRLFPANERVAHDSLRGKLDGVTFVSGEEQSIAAPVVDLCAVPAKTGTRQRQRLFGERVNVLEDRAGFSFVVCEDGYVGYIASDKLSDPVDVEFSVATFATHSYEQEDFKSRMLQPLSFGARLKVLNERPKFYETNAGFVSKKHLRPLDRPFEDPATIAQLHFNVPYLWGGNSTGGIDCSGLIAAACLACSIPCPADSDMQREQVGAFTKDDTRLKRGDLIFWKGHVGLMVDEDTLIHANAHHMATRYEPLDAAIVRIAAQGDGPVLARKRL